MAGLFEGLLGGGSDPYELYGDLLNDTQKAALRDQQTTRGLLQAAAIFSKAGQASRLPVSIPWGEAAAAFGGGQDEALKGIMTAAQIRELQSKAKIRDQMFGPEANAKMDALLKAFGMGGGSTGTPAAASGPSPAGTYIPDPAKPALPMVNPALGPVELDAGGTPAAGMPTIPLDAPGPQTGLLPPPDQVAGLSGPGVLARIAAMQQGGGGGSPAPFGGDQASSLRLASHINYGGTGALGNPAEAGWRSSNIVPVPAPGGASFNVHRAAAPDFAGFLQDLSALGYKIDPKTSGGYNYRNIRGSNSLSEHAYGTAIDINSNANLYTRDGRKVTDLPPEVGALAAKHNLEWGGNWKDPVDTMHFQWRGPGGEASATATPGGQDQVIPSGQGVPANMLRTVADTGGGVPGMPPVPVPPGVNPAAMNGLLIELARRNAAAEALGMGNPYGSMLSVLQGSPQYKAAIETATRGAGLPFVRPEAAEKAAGAFPFDMAGKQYQAALDRATNEAKMLGEARNDPAEIKVSDGKGGEVIVQGTREQKVRAAQGLPVPELGITGIFRPGATGLPPAGSLATTPVDPPGYAEATTIMLKERRPKAEAAVKSLNFNETAQRLLDAGIISGYGAGFRLDAAKAKALLGWDDQRIANTETFLATQARQVAAILGSGDFGSGASITDEDRRQAARMAGADSALDEKSLRFLVRLNGTAANWEIDRYKADVKRHDPKGRLPILQIDVPPKAETKPSANQPTPIGQSKIGDKSYVKWSDGQWRPEGELPGEEKR